MNFFENLLTFCVAKLCLVRNYLATQNKENFRMKLTDNPQYPREYRPERLEKDKDYQMFCLLHAG